MFFAGIAVGAVLGVEEEELGAAIIPLVLLMAFGLPTVTPKRWSSRHRQDIVRGLVPGGRSGDFAGCERRAMDR